MKKTLLILLPLVALLWTGCEEKVIDIDPGLTQKVPVAVARVEADSAISLRLTFSRFFLDTHPFAEIDNATVSLTVNGNPDAAAVTHVGGNYSIAYTPQAGDRLGLRVLVPGQNVPLTAETTMPTTPVVSTAHVSQGTDNNGSPVFNIRFRLTDDAATRDYYSIRLRSIDTLIHTYNINQYSTVVVSDTTPRDMFISFSCNDVILKDNTNLSLDLDGSTPMSWLPFSDELISGTSHDITISIPRDTASTTPGNAGGESGTYVDTYQYTIPKLYLEVTSYSYDRYLYELTLSTYDGDMLSAMFTEPVQIHTNVQGGIGIFAASSRAVQQLQMNE